MGGKTQKPSQALGRARRRTVKPIITSKPGRAEAPGSTASNLATKRFVNDLLVRGEAAKRTKRGKLPLHATHVIKRQNKDGTVEVERVRFKAF